MRAALLIVCCGWLSAVPAMAYAQARPAASNPFGEGRLEIAGAVGIANGHHLKTEPATESGNGVPTGSPVTLFQTDTSFDRGTLFEGRVSWRVARAFAVEGTFSITRTHLRTEIKNDSEGAAPTVATSPLNQYTAEGGIVWQPTRLRFHRGRARIFITGGGGYLRQLHDDATLVETGGSAYAGGGLKYRLHEATKRAALKAIGIRVDGRLNLLRGGFDVVESAWHAYPSLSAGLFVCF
jgi:hypothetical protein